MIPPCLYIKMIICTFNIKEIIYTSSDYFVDLILFCSFLHVTFHNVKRVFLKTVFKSRNFLKLWNCSNFLNINDLLILMTIRVLTQISRSTKHKKIVRMGYRCTINTFLLKAVINWFFMHLMLSQYSIKKKIRKKSHFVRFS